MLMSVNRCWGKRTLYLRYLIVFAVLAMILCGCGGNKYSKKNDLFVGHWLGTARDSEGHEIVFTAKVIAKGKDKYRILILDDFDTGHEPMHVLDGVLKDGKYVYVADKGKYTGEGELVDDKFTAYYKGPVNGSFEMRSLEHKTSLESTSALHTTISVNSDSSSSKHGSIISQGAHHSAQKSTKTGLSDSSTC